MAVTLPAAVDPAKTIVWGGLPHGGGRFASSNPNGTRVAFDLESPTVLALERLGSPADSPVVEWQAIEFSSGVSVQRGVRSLRARETTVNVRLPTPVDLGKSFVLVSVAANMGSQSVDERWTIRSRLTSPTSLELSRREAGIVVDAYWQVIQMDGASVQRGLKKISGSGASSRIAAVDPAKSFLVMSYRAGAGVNGVESRYLLRGRITDARTVTFNRAGSGGDVEVAWEVVTMSDGTTVQRGSRSTAAPDDMILEQPITAVDPNRAFVYISAQGGSRTSTSNLDEGAWTAALTAPTNLRLQRSGTGTHAIIDWQVIQFAAAPAVGPARLAVISVNGGSNPSAGVGFAVVVQSQDNNGNPANVTQATGVSLSLRAGTGTLGGTLAGTIAAGSSLVEISGVTYSKAESGVAITAARSSGDPLASGDSGPFTVNPGTATKLAFTAQPVNTTAGNPIAGPPTVAVQDGFGNIVTSSTASITITIGNNPSGATLSGTLVRSADSGVVGFTDLGIHRAGTAYTLMASSPGLASVASSAFDVNSGAPSALAFTTQPAGATAGSAIPGPPTVTVQDGFGNTVTSSTAAITIAIGNNPGAGTLSGTLVKNAVSGTASFSDLRIDKAGAGYTLAASSTGLASATSSPFNVAPAAGAIAGRVMRAADGTPIGGALVEAFQFGAVKGSATTLSDGSYLLEGLAEGSYDVRASATGLGSQTHTAVQVISGATASLNFSLSDSIAITSPAAGAVLQDHSVLVRGRIDPGLGADVGVTVNGFVGLVDSGAGEFAALVPVDESVTGLVAELRDGRGALLGSHSISVAVESLPVEPVLFFLPSPPTGTAPLTAGFSLTSLSPIVNIALDANGDGTTDFNLASLEGQTFLYDTPGLYFPKVRVTDESGVEHTAETILQVFEPLELDGLLQAKWEAMKGALRQGDIDLALSYIVASRRETYRAMFEALTVPLAEIDGVLAGISLVEQRGIEAEYEMIVSEGGFQHSYLVLFALDLDGVWRIKFF